MVSLSQRCTGSHWHVESVGKVEEASESRVGRPRAEERLGWENIELENAKIWKWEADDDNDDDDGDGDGTAKRIDRGWATVLNYRSAWLHRFGA